MRRKWQPTPVFLTRESHGQRSLVGYASWGKQEVKNHGDELHCGICEWVLAVYTLEATIRAKHLLKLLSIRQTRCNQVKGYRPWAKQQRKKPSVEIIF